MTLRRLAAAVTAGVLALAALAVPGARVVAQPDRRPTPSWSVPAPTRSPLPPIVVMSVGDSLTWGADGSALASYRSELSRLMDLTGQPHRWVVAAWGGTKCSWWADRMLALIAQHDPDLILLNCGTNDVPGDPTEQDYRRILAIAESRGVPVVASLIGIPDMRSPTNTVRPWIIDWMHGTNLAIGRALADHPGVPVADMQRVPATPEWLDPDGIHLTPRSEAAWGQLFYQAAQPIWPGWLTLAQMRLAEMCGLSGAWLADPAAPWPRPDIDYRVCRS